MYRLIIESSCCVFLEFVWAPLNGTMEIGSCNARHTVKKCEKVIVMGDFNQARKLGQG